MLTSQLSRPHIPGPLGSALRASTSTAHACRPSSSRRHSPRLRCRCSGYLRARARRWLGRWAAGWLASRSATNPCRREIREFRARLASGGALEDLTIARVSPASTLGRPSTHSARPHCPGTRQQPAARSRPPGSYLGGVGNRHGRRRQCRLHHRRSGRCLLSYLDQP